jgi:hypothetical protein
MAFAKTTRPTLAGTLARPRLFRLLDRARRRPVTWVCAPPGAGKTTLVASYLAARRQRVLWYQADAGDPTPRRSSPSRLGSAPAPPAAPASTAEYRHGVAVFAGLLPRALRPAESALHRGVRQLPEVPRESALRASREALGEIPKHGRVIFISRVNPRPHWPPPRASDDRDSGWPGSASRPRSDGTRPEARPGRWPGATLRPCTTRQKGGAPD